MRRMQRPRKAEEDGKKRQRNQAVNGKVVPESEMHALTGAFTAAP